MSSSRCESKHLCVHAMLNHIIDKMRGELMAVKITSCKLVYEQLDQVSCCHCSIDATVFVSRLCQRVGDVGVVSGDRITNIILNIGIKANGCCGIG